VGVAQDLDDPEEDLGRVVTLPESKTFFDILANRPRVFESLLPWSFWDNVTGIDLMRSSMQAMRMCPDWSSASKYLVPMTWEKELASSADTTLSPRPTPETPRRMVGMGMCSLALSTSG